MSPFGCFSRLALVEGDRLLPRRLLVKLHTVLDEEVSTLMLEEFSHLVDCFHVSFDGDLGFEEIVAVFRKISAVQVKYFHGFDLVLGYLGSRHIQFFVPKYW